MSLEKRVKKGADVSEVVQKSGEPLKSHVAFHIVPDRVKNDSKRSKKIKSNKKHLLKSHVHLHKSA